MRKSFPSARRRQAGVTMVELLVALLVFGIVSAAAFQLYAQHIRVYSQQQDLAALNLSLRNALTMIQMDLNNAGTGVFVGANVPSWPIGVTIENNPAGYDTFHIVTAVAGVPPVHPTDIGTNCVSTTSSVLFVNPPPNHTVAQTAAHFRSGDQILLVKADGSQMTSVVLTQDGQPSGNKVQLHYQQSEQQAGHRLLRQRLGDQTPSDYLSGEHRGPGEPCTRARRIRRRRSGRGPDRQF
jgi:prepilin-type N-terminal cleavage/methylation domain-containing protein